MIKIKQLLTTPQKFLQRADMPSTYSSLISAQEVERTQGKVQNTRFFNFQQWLHEVKQPTQKRPRGRVLSSQCRKS